MAFDIKRNWHNDREDSPKKPALDWINDIFSKFQRLVSSNLENKFPIPYLGWIIQYCFLAYEKKY